MSTQRVLILLEESYPDALPWPDEFGADQLKDELKCAIDWICEAFEGLTTQLVTSGAYDQIIPLVDVNCTYENLKTHLINHTIEGDTIDLVILGHGSADNLVLHGTERLNGKNIAEILDEAKLKGCSSVNLRLVYMCNCYGSTLNEAWTAIGAKVAIGPKCNDYMPEPMTSEFLILWAEKGECASDAALHAYNYSKAAYWAIPVPLPLLVGTLYASNGWFETSRLMVTGNGGVTRGFQYSGRPTLSQDVTNLPPHLKDVVVAQPAATAIPIGFAVFAGQTANVRYSGSWTDGLSGSTRDLTLYQNGLLEAGRPGYIFLRFGPRCTDGHYREMQVSTLLLAAGDGANWTNLGPVHSGLDANGAYYWAEMALPNPAAVTTVYTLKIDGKDAIAHADRPSGPRGDQVDSDPRSVASIDVASAGFPFLGYTPGSDRSHKLLVAAIPARDSREGNDSFETATLVDLRTQTTSILAGLSLFPSGDADFFRVLLPESSDAATWMGGAVVPSGGNRWFSLSAHAASVQIEVTFEDLGEGTPVPDVRIFDGQKNEQSKGGAFIQVAKPGAAFPDHSFYVRVANTVAKSVNYTAKFTFWAAGWRMFAHPPELYDVRQMVSKNGNPVINVVLGETGRPEKPEAALDLLRDSLDYAAINVLSRDSSITAATGFLVGLGQVLVEAGRPGAQQVLEKAQDLAQKSGDRPLVVAALNGQGSLFRAKHDRAGLQRIHQQLAGLEERMQRVIVTPHA
jgi:hypothetical protein